MRESRAIGIHGEHYRRFRMVPNCYGRTTQFGAFNPSSIRYGDDDRKNLFLFSNSVSLSVACLNFVDPASRPSVQFAVVLEGAHERSSTCGNERDRQWENLQQGASCLVQLQTWYLSDIISARCGPGLTPLEHRWACERVMAVIQPYKGKTFGVKY